MGVPTHAVTDKKDIPQFDKDIRDVHLIYDYDVRAKDGSIEKWKYEMYLSLSHSSYPKSPTFISMVLFLLSWLDKLHLMDRV